MKGILLALLAVGVLMAHAQSPRTLSYQGVLTDANGNPRANSTYYFTFKLYDVATSGSPLWTQAESLLVNRGLFSTTLDKNPFAASMKFDKQYWLGIQVGSEADLSPRVALSGTAYSMNALRADTAEIAKQSEGAWVANDTLAYRLIGKVGIGTASPTNALDVFGGLSVQGNHFFLRNRSAPIGKQTWGAVVSGSSGRIAIGPSTDVPPSGGSLTKTFVVIEPEDGNVGIGTTNPTAKLEVIGRTRTQILEVTGGADLAEPFHISASQTIEAGSVVVIDNNNPGHLTLSQREYDTRVAGVISGAGGISPGLTLRQEGVMEGTQNIALSGRVYVKASACNGSILPGDLLTTSAVPGHAMRAQSDLARPGVILGKALSALVEGSGLVLVLVNLQ